MVLGILLVGSVLFLASTIVYFYLKGNFTWALTITLILGIGLRVYCSLDGRLHDWDERYHALVAKNMIEQPFKPMLYKNPVLPYDYKDWSGNHIWVHKQPVPLWLMSVSIAIFGTNVISVRLVSIILSSLLILLIYGIGKELFNRKVGIISSFLFAINGYVLEIGSGRAATDHVDLIFLFFITFAVWLSIIGAKKNKYLFAIFIGISLGLAILTKWLPALIVLPIWVLVNLQIKNSFSFIVKTSVTISGFAFLIAFPWQWYIIHTFPKEAFYEYAYNTRHIVEVLGTEESFFFYNLKHLRITFGEYLYLPMFILCIFLLQKWRSSYFFKLSMLWIWIFVPLIFFSFVKTKMPGYILFTLPALYLLTAYVFVYFRSKWRENIYFNVVAFIVLIVLPLRYTFERVKPFDHRFQRAYTEKYDSKTIVFNDNYHIETMFFTECYAAYPYSPSPHVIDSLRESGFTVIRK